MDHHRLLRISLLWPPQQVMAETLFRHYVELVEVASYLSKCTLSKFCRLSVEVHDCTISIYSPSRLASISKNSDVIAIAINPYNVCDAIKVASFLRSVNPHIYIIAYGSFCCYGASQLTTSSLFDYIISTGEWELGIEVALYYCGFVDKSELHSSLRNEKKSFSLNNKTIRIMDGLRLDPSEWGLPSYENFPIREYLRVGDGTINLRVARGCPYKCAFCDEIYVGGDGFRYRPVSQVIQFLTNYPDGAKVAYLNASAFTANKGWVLDLCSEIKKKKINLPWRVCTRLDLVDKELIQQMASAGCKRISFGIESLETAAQNWTGKTANSHRIRTISSWCNETGITPRALLILGLPGQTAEGIRKENLFFKDIGMETRYRPLLKLDQFAKDINMCSLSPDYSDRWSTPVHIEGMSTMDIRALEFNL